MNTYTEPQTSFLKPLTSGNGNTVYVIYSQLEEKDSKDQPLICVRIAQEGWTAGAREWKFSVRKYNSPNAFQVRIAMTVENTQGFVADTIALTDFKPVFPVVAPASL